VIWRTLNNPSLGFINHWSDSLLELETKHAGILPDLRSSKTLVITSDYGGYHKGATHETISFLLAALDQCLEWEAKRRHLRKKMLSDGRRMSYKKLGDVHRRRALASFLDAADCIPGVLVSFSTAWNLPFSLTGSEETPRGLSSIAPSSLFGPRVFRRLIRTVSFVLLFLAGLSAPGQNVTWFSDEDDFAADEQRLRSACNVIMNAAGHVLPHTLGHIRLGTTKSDDGSRSLEDLAALPDLAAGALTDMLAHMRPSLLLQGLPSQAAEKSRRILSWLADQSGDLKKLSCVLSSGDKPQTLRTQWLTIHSENAAVQPVTSEYHTSIFNSAFGHSK
jgi:hypothetical protein